MDELIHIFSPFQIYHLKEEPGGCDQIDDHDLEDKHLRETVYLGRDLMEAPHRNF